MHKSGLYLYAIIPAAVTLGPILGIHDKRVYTVREGDVAAVVSDTDNQKIRPQRKNLACHQQVLHSLMSSVTPLPIKFGTITEDKKELEELLQHHHDSFSQQLHSLKNTVEMGLRLNWCVPNIFEHLVHTHSELKAMREQVMAKSQSGRDDMIEIGYRLSQALEEERRQHTKIAQEALADFCLDTKVNNLRKENEVMNLACLITKDKLPVFEKKVYAIARLFNDDFILDYNGPWAPHNFVDISISLNAD